MRFGKVPVPCSPPPSTMVGRVLAVAFCAVVGLSAPVPGLAQDTSSPDEQSGTPLLQGGVSTNDASGGDIYNTNTGDPGNSPPPPVDPGGDPNAPTVIPGNVTSNNSPSGGGYWAPPPHVPCGMNQLEAQAWGGGSPAGGFLSALGAIMDPYCRDIFSGQPRPPRRQPQPPNQQPQPVNQPPPPNQPPSQNRQTPTFHYFYINGIHTPMNGPARPPGVPGGYYTYEYGLVNSNLVHSPRIKVRNETDYMEPYTHNFSQMDPLWTTIGAKICNTAQQYVGYPGQVAVQQNVTDAIAAVLCPLLKNIDQARANGQGDLAECFVQDIKPENFSWGLPEILVTTMDPVVQDVVRRIINAVRQEQALDPNSRSTNYFIVVGHSQGNFFTEAVGYVLANLAGPTGAYVFKNRLALLSLASPTSYDSLTGDADFYANKIAHVTRRDDGIQVVNALSLFGVLGKKPWPREQDVAALDASWTQSKLDYFFDNIQGAIAANSAMNAPQPGGSFNPLVAPLMNAHLLDSYLVAQPTYPKGAPSVLNDVQMAVRRLKISLLTSSQLTGMR